VYDWGSEIQVLSRGGEAESDGGSWRQLWQQVLPGRHEPYAEDERPDTGQSLLLPRTSESPDTVTESTLLP